METTIAKPARCKMPGCSYQTNDGRKYCSSCLLLKMLDYQFAEKPR
jgi:hypothetical protein